MDLSAIIGAVGNAASGGLLGIIGGIGGHAVTGWLNLKTQAQKNEHDLAMITAEQATIRLEADSAVKIERARGQVKESEMELKALVASYKADNKQYFDSSYMTALPAWVQAWLAVLFAHLDFIKGAMRPALAVWLTALVTGMLVMGYQADSELFTKTIIQLLPIIIKTILTLFVTAVTWYYADRRAQKYLDKMMGS